MINLRHFFSGLQKGMQDFGHNIVLLINSILLSIVYFIGIGFTSIVARLFGKHFLETKMSKKEETYWHNLDLKKKSIEEYYRQF